jgi:sulfonate transport system ATP-binding protein
LLRILAGLDGPTSGEILFDGRPARQSPHVARLMFQESRLLPWASVLGNVEVGLGARRSAPRAEAHARAKLAAVGLEARADEWPSVLSGGQKQRVALARALASSPHFLALDEPLGALDALTRIEMQSLLERVWREQRFTAVLVTHDVTEAIMLGDRVVLIEDGIIKLDVDVPVERPRRRGSPQVATLEQRILRHLFADGAYIAQGAA